MPDLSRRVSHRQPPFLFCSISTLNNANSQISNRTFSSVLISPLQITVLPRLTSASLSLNANPPILLAGRNRPPLFTCPTSTPDLLNRSIADKHCFASSSSGIFISMVSCGFSSKPKSHSIRWTYFNNFLCYLTSKRPSPCCYLRQCIF